jgi:phosphoribosylformylglycinamidine cyclo-ligase
MRYRDAGVDIERADSLKDAIGRVARDTWTEGVRRLPGGFAGMMAWPAGEPRGGPALLAATMDGVGTKLHVALEAGRVADASADLVYHCANDLLAHGARPVAFLDYVAQSRLDRDVIRSVVEGLGRACREVGAVLLGGETAEMPDTYVERVVDVAGCMIGTAGAADVLDGGRVEPGDVLLGLASAGLHTNGFSLARRVVSRSGMALSDDLPGAGGVRLVDALLAPHRWYGRAVLPRVTERGLHAIAHVTGGGVAGNLVRVLPEGCEAVVGSAAWARPPLFRWLCDAGAIPEEDARQAFNLGLGLIVVAAPDAADSLARAFEEAGETVHAVGVVRAGPRRVIWE